MEPAKDFTFVSNPDFQKISTLMIKTWELPCIEFTPQVLEMYLNVPTVDKELVLV